MRALLLLPLIAIFAFAQAPEQRRQPTRFTAEQRAQCEARGGRVAIAGLSGDDMCAERYADAGRVCTGGGDCLGDCMLDEASLRGKRPVDGMRAAGRCQERAYMYGCRNLIENGRLIYGLCID
jgi:hypothetical protein